MVYLDKGTFFLHVINIRQSVFCFSLFKVYYIFVFYTFDRICPKIVDMYVLISYSRVVVMLYALNHCKVFICQITCICIDVMVCYGQKIISVVDVCFFHLFWSQVSIGVYSVTMKISFKPDCIGILEKDCTFHYLNFLLF